MVLISSWFLARRLVFDMLNFFLFLLEYIYVDVFESQVQNNFPTFQGTETFQSSRTEKE